MLYGVDLVLTWYLPENIESLNQMHHFSYAFTILQGLNFYGSVVVVVIDIHRRISNVSALFSYKDQINCTH